MVGTGISGISLRSSGKCGSFLLMGDFPPECSFGCQPFLWVDLFESRTIQAFKIRNKGVEAKWVSMQVRQVHKFRFWLQCHDKVFTTVSSLLEFPFGFVDGMDHSTVCSLNMFERQHHFNCRCHISRGVGVPFKYRESYNFAFRFCQ